MRIIDIEIKNFRQYRDLTLHFPKNKKNDLHIIVADNGVGKTNILNAITWCLYGEEPHLGNSSKSLPRLNLKTKEQAINDNKKDECISVKITAEDDGELIIYERKMNVKVDTNFEAKAELTVIVSSDPDSDPKIVSNNDAESYVEKYMPQKIRKYFYFDGEQLDNYFISDESSKIKETIHAISQVDIVSRVKERLGKLLAEKRKEAGQKKPDLKILNDKIMEKSSEIDGFEDKLDEINVQICTSETIIKNNSEKLRGQENLPALEDKYEELKNRKIELDENLKKCKKELFVFTREMIIALNLYKSAKKTLDIIAEKEAINALPPNIDKSILIKMLSDNECMCTICHQPLSEESKKHIKEILEKIQVSSETSNLLMRIRSELGRIVDEAKKYPEKKMSILKSHGTIEKALKDCGEELQLVDNEIHKFSDGEQVIRWHEERKNHEELLKNNAHKRSLLEIQLENAKKEKKEYENKYSKALEKEKECQRLKNLEQFVLASQEIVSEIECNMMTEVRKKMEKRTMDYFLDLIWKKGVYDHIELDEKYQLNLIHKDGYSCVGSCSAAERSLLALSFTLALHEVSGFNSLLFIDTPVARVTSQNRTNFANVLKKLVRESS